MALAAAVGGCREMIARVVPHAHLNSFVRACPDRVVAMGDSIQFSAYFMIKNAPGGMQGPYDNVMLYTSEERPLAFHWRLTYPSPPSYAPAKAEITRTGLLIARDTGVVYVHASGAGKHASRIEMRVVPRVARFALFPHDTAVQVGDTVFLRANAELERETLPGRTFSWTLPLAPHESVLVERVEEDPDSRIRRDVRAYPLVALRPGTLKVAACFAGARRDTATIRISGVPRVANRDVPPDLRFTPGDTVVYVGDEFHARVRILNARLYNGPYRWLATTGDGGSHADSSTGPGVPSAFGFDASVIVQHRYFTPGRYPVLLTVTDSAGRSTRVRATYTAIVREFELKLLLPEGQGAVRLSDDSANIAIAVLSNRSKGLFAQHIAGAFVLTRMHGTPALLFGHTAFDPELDGRRRVTKDVNSDGELDDVFYLDKATLARNGDLRAGRNRLVLTGVTGQRIGRPGRGEAAAEFWPPIHGVVEFDVIP